MLLNC